MRYFYDVLLPRVVYLPWVFSWFCLVFLSPFHWLLRTLERTKSSDSNIYIEAGSQGWNSIEFKELYQSASEYIGEDRVTKIVVSDKDKYIEEVTHVLKNNKITHYLYDPRTGSQGWMKGLYQSLRIAILFQRYNITPITLLTDFSLRQARALSAVVTARKGVVVSFISVKMVKSIFPHSRILSPIIMPFSKKLLNNLTELAVEKKNNSTPYAIFTGSLYEPRESILGSVQKIVVQNKGDFRILRRLKGNVRVSDEEYWRRIINADIVFTTSDQVYSKTLDLRNVAQLVYRYLEVLASGVLLVAQDVPSIRRYFTPGIHFVSYEKSNDAAEKIVYYLENEEERKTISTQGYLRARALIESRLFWVQIDSALSKRSIF